MGDKADLIVIGAGAAGILAAWRAACMGVRVVLLEKTNRIGTKILISGGGKCNITHDGPLEDVLRAFRPHEARFIRPACYRFRPHQIVEMLTSRGLEVYTREDGRIFPVHQTAKDVVRILRSYLDEAGVDVRLETPVRKLLWDSSGIMGARTETGDVLAPRVILCVGGASYPNSGTTGDGWPWVRELGHTIVPVRAALAPIYLQLLWEPPSGVAFRDCVLKGLRGAKAFVRWRGDLLFTHHGVSGPCALGISREVVEQQLEGEVSLSVDAVPDSTFEELRDELIQLGRERPHLRVSSFVEERMASRLAQMEMEAAGIAPGTSVGQLDKKNRNRLVEVLKDWNLGPVRVVPLEKGEVVAGGIALDEVDPKTLKSRVTPGLWCCGEVLDIAGPVGGYNLQAAWATGFVAGEEAAQEILQESGDVHRT